MYNLSNIVIRLHDFKLIGTTSVSNYKGTTKFRRKFTRSVWCSFHDRVADLNGDRGSLGMLLVKHFLPRSFKLLPSGIMDGLETVKL